MGEDSQKEREIAVVESMVQFSESRRNSRELGASLQSSFTRLGNSALKKAFQIHYILL